MSTPAASKKKPSSKATPGASSKSSNGNSASGSAVKKSPARPDEATRDARFERIGHDPRFARALSTKKGHAPLTKGNDKAKSAASKQGQDKLVVDQRFSSMFSDPEFLPAGGVQAAVDKRGRAVNPAEERPADVTRYYELEQKEESAEKADVDDDKARLERLNKLARGELEGSSSESESEEEGSEEEEEEREEIDLGEATSRLACVNCNWDHTRAVDILAVLESFCPSTGSILDVTVYPSEFGKQRMAQENLSGPAIEPSTAAASKKSTSKKQQQQKENEDEGHEEGENFDPEALRAYEKSRLRYYFAIITCDSAATANHLYEECDGLEFEHSAITFDMRFVPDEQTFNKEEIRDLATFVPEDYAPIPFETKALQQTSVSLTWDEHEFERTAVLENWDQPRAKAGAPISTKQIEQYIASSSDSDDDGEDDEKIQRIRALLNLGTKQKEQRDAAEAKASVPEPAAKEKVASKKTKGKSSAQKSNKGESNGDVDSDDEENYKSAKRRRLEDKGESAELDVKDDRFANLFSDPAYALDRSDPKYQASTLTKSIDREVEKRRSAKGDGKSKGRR